MLLWTWHTNVSSSPCFLFSWVYTTKWNCWIILADLNGEVIWSDLHFKVTLDFEERTYSTEIPRPLHKHCFKPIYLCLLPEGHLWKMIAKKIFFKRTNSKRCTWIHRGNQAKRLADKILKAGNQIVTDLRRWNINCLHWGKPRIKLIQSCESGRARWVTGTGPNKTGSLLGQPTTKYGVTSATHVHNLPKNVWVALTLLTMIYIQVFTDISGNPDRVKQRSNQPWIFIGMTG